MPPATGTRRPSAPLVISLLALFVSLCGAGYAATGGNFILGETNTATSTTRLSASIPAPSLRIVNADPADGSTPLSLTAASGRPPLSVNSTHKVPKLNADLLDGLDTSELTQPACTSQTGALKGFARIDASSSFPSTFTTAGVAFPYNCSAGTVEARRIGKGKYEVRFNGSGVQLAIGSLANTSTGVVNFARQPGTAAVFSAQAAAGGGSLEDIPFVIVTP